MTSPALDDAGLFVRWHPSRVAGYHMLRQELSIAFAVDERTISVTRMCGGCGSTSHGPPRVRAWPHRATPFVSVARCNDMTVVAWSLHGPVGVDVERGRAADFDGFPGVVLHPAERAHGVGQLTRTWVRKESLLKATGQGLSVDPAAIRLTEPWAPPALVAWEAADSSWHQDSDARP